MKNQKHDFISVVLEAGREEKNEKIPGMGRYKGWVAFPMASSTLTGYKNWWHLKNDLKLMFPSIRPVLMYGGVQGHFEPPQWAYPE